MLTLRLSDEFRASLTAAAASFNTHISPETVDYLAARGIDHAAIARFQLGTVDDSAPGYADYAGMLCIPYQTPRGGVCGLKFRRPHECTDLCTHVKYLSPHETRLYNPAAFDRGEELGYVAVTEGELNAITLTHYCGIPAVGIPGVETWTRHIEWQCLFRGFKRVLMFADDDEAGKELGRKIVREIETAEIVRLPAKDANSAYVEWGPEQIRMVAGV